MVADTSSAASSYGRYGEGDETFLRRAGTVAQRRHTRKTTQLAADAAAMSLALSNANPMPGTPMSLPSSASDGEYPGDASSIDMGNSPTSSITTADAQSIASITSQAFDADNFTLPPLPQPHVPLRKTSATNLRQIAVSNSYDRSTADAESPRQSQFPERRSSRIASPRLPRDRQSPPTSSSEDVSSKENVPVGPVPPRGRARGMTTVGQRPQGDSSSQFRSPSIPDLRGNARAHMSSTYKPERGPASRDHSLAFRAPPPMPWKESEEVRQSFRSAITNTSYATYTSSGYYEPSETERSSVATRSSNYSNYSQQRDSAADDDDFDACDYIDLYAGGFMDDDDKSQRSERNSLRKAATRTSAIQASRYSIIDPAIQSPLSPYDEPDPRPSSIQFARSPALSLDSRPSSIQKPFGLGLAEGNNVPTKCDSKFDEDEAIMPRSPPLPQSPPLTQSTPSSPALLSHPVNPAAPPSPLSPFPPTLNLRVEENYVSQPVSPLSRMDFSPLDAPVFQPSPLDADASGFFPPMKPVTTAVPLPPQSHTSSFSSSASAVPRDRYGFKKSTRDITVEQYDAWNVGYEQYLQRRKTKWEIMLIQWGLPINNPTRFPPRSDKVKRYIRKGIPPEWRGNAWFLYAGGPERLHQNPGLYEKRLREAAQGKLVDNDQDAIEKDLPRTFPDQIDFKPDSVNGEESAEEVPIIQALRRVLQAFAVENPSIGYCQSLHYLAGMMLLFIKDEEKTFHLLNILCNTHMPGVHNKRLDNIDVGVLMSCIQDSLPQVWSKIDDMNAGARGYIATSKLPTISLTCTSWLMSCFVNNLPTESALRVWDCLFYEGSKTLFRIALALCKMGQPEILASESLETLQVVQAIPRRALDINLLMESCYKRRNGFGHLSQDVIDNRRKERRANLQKELDLKNGQLSPHVLQDMQRPPSRGRKGTLSRAASRARGLSRAKSRKRAEPPTPVLPDDVPPTPPLSRQGTGNKF